MQHAPITTPITDKLASMTWIRWFRQLVDRVDEIKGTADAPAWESITGKPDEFPPETHTHPQYIETETDPTVPEYVKDITEADIALWSLASASGGGQAIAGVTGAPLGELTYTPGTLNNPAIIDGQSYRQVLMPDGNVWTGENVKGSRSSYTLDSAGYTFRQQGANDLNDWLVANDVNGWRVPTEAEWTAFCASIPGSVYYPGIGATTSNGNVYYDGRYSSSSPGVGAQLKLPSGWASPYNVAPYVSSNEFGFSAKNSDNVPVLARWRCYIPGFGIYTRTWFVADNSASIHTVGDYSYNNGAHLRLVRPVSEGESLYGSVDVPAFSVRLFPDDAFLGDAKVYSVPAQTIDAPAPDTRYYLCAQRTGDAVALVMVEHADVYTINMSNIVPLWRLEIHGNEIHQIHYDNMGDGLPNKQEFAQLRTEPYRLAVEGGFAVTLGSGRSLSMTGAEVFFGHHRVSVLGFASATDTVHDFFHVAGVWDDAETVGGWAWDNLNYDNGTALTALGNNKWGAIFVYRSIGDSKEIFVVRGQTEASHIEEARLIGIPPTPDLIQWHTMLVGRILFEESAATGEFEPYSTGTFLRSQTLQIALDDLTDVTVTGAAEASVLQKNLAGQWVGDLLPWDDMRHITGLRLTGANNPSYSSFGTSMYGWMFAAGDLLSADSEQIPHSWAGTPIRPHVHFGSDNGGTGDIVWEVTISTRPAKIGAWSAEQTITKTWTGTLAALGVDALDLWDSPGVTLVNTGASTLMKMRIRMVSKTFTGNVFLDGFDSHIQHKRIGTINEFGPL